MTWENSETDYAEYLESMITANELAVKEKLARDHEEASDTRLRTLAARSYFGYTRENNSYVRGVIAAVQRLVINSENEKQLVKLLLDDLRLVRQLLAKPGQDELNKISSERHDAHTAITKLMESTGIHSDAIWAMLPEVHGGETRLQYLKRYTGIPVDIEKLTSGFILIDNMRQEAWMDGSETYDSEQARKDAYTTHKTQETYDNYDEQYVYLRIPRGASPQEIRDTLSGETLKLFSDGMQRSTSRKLKVIDNFAEKLFALRLKESGVSNKAISAKLLNEYGLAIAYSEIDDFLVTLRK